MTLCIMTEQKAALSAKLIEFQKQSSREGIVSPTGTGKKRKQHRITLSGGR